MVHILTNQSALCAGITMVVQGQKCPLCLPYQGTILPTWITLNPSMDNILYGGDMRTCLHALAAR